MGFFRQSAILLGRLFQYSSYAVMENMRYMLSPYDPNSEVWFGVKNDNSQKFQRLKYLILRRRIALLEVMMIIYTTTGAFTNPKKI